MTDFILSIDFFILDFIRAHCSCAFLDAAMPVITNLNNRGEIWIFIGLCLLFTKRYKKYGAYLLIGLLVGLFLGNGVLKNLIARPRPFHIRPEISLIIPPPGAFSFPSGHTLSSFIAAFILLKADKRLGIGGLVLASLIAFSRMYLYVHFLTDILGAILLAGVISYVVLRVGEKLTKPGKWYRKNCEKNG